jgi:hypothetical protein
MIRGKTLNYVCSFLLIGWGPTEARGRQMPISRGQAEQSDVYSQRLPRSGQYSSHPTKLNRRRRVDTARHTLFF